MHPLGDSVTMMRAAWQLDAHVSPVTAIEPRGEWTTILPVHGEKVGRAARFPGVPDPELVGDGPVEPRASTRR